MIYFFLRNKEMRTYSNFFEMILDHVQQPLTLNCDFEKSILGAAKQIFNECRIYGCFFHLSQNWWKREGQLNLIPKLLIDSSFKKVFKMCQALAYLPIHHVVEGYELIKGFEINTQETNFLNYIEKN